MDKMLANGWGVDFSKLEGGSADNLRRLLYGSDLEYRVNDTAYVKGKGGVDFYNRMTLNDWCVVCLKMYGEANIACMIAEYLSDDVYHTYDSSICVGKSTEGHSVMLVDNRVPWLIAPELHNVSCRDFIKEFDKALGMYLEGDPNKHYLEYYDFWNNGVPEGYPTAQVFGDNGDIPF